ncbi:XdhC family protein [Synechococcus sp. R6-10]|uniref:XdhC family protein n=1 Tax=Synechococcus sp. R6-10 TaxID=2291956 RepID=UPI0039C0B479
MDETFYRQLADMLSRGPLVVATVIRTQGSVPRQAGAKLAVGSDGTLLGTVGGGAAEAEVIARAQTLLRLPFPLAMARAARSTSARRSPGRLGCRFPSISTALPWAFAGDGCTFGYSDGRDPLPKHWRPRSSRL